MESHCFFFRADCQSSLADAINTELKTDNRNYMLNFLHFVKHLDWNGLVSKYIRCGILIALYMAVIYCIYSILFYCNEKLINLKVLSHNKPQHTDQDPGVKQRGHV